LISILVLNFVLSVRSVLRAAVATPKQIRELMKVDGLTNDEVKSHLQVTSRNAAIPVLRLPLGWDTEQFQACSHS
jgi:SHAQKYF class myb-like DNA-binding protein